MTESKFESVPPLVKTKNCIWNTFFCNWINLPRWDHNFPHTKKKQRQRHTIANNWQTMLRTRGEKKRRDEMSDKKSEDNESDYEEERSSTEGCNGARMANWSMSAVGVNCFIWRQQQGGNYGGNWHSPSPRLRAIYLSQIDTEHGEGLQEPSRSHWIGHLVISAASSCLALPRHPP